MLPIWQITIFFQNSFSSGLWIPSSCWWFYLNCFHSSTNKTKSIKGVVQSNGVKIKVIILWTHINIRNKVEKVSANYHCEKYEKIFVYFLLNETKWVIFAISLNKF